MFAIKDSCNGRQHIIVGGFDSFSAAVDYAKGNFPIASFEQDGETAADFVTTVGGCYAIEAV